MLHLRFPRGRLQGVPKWRRRRSARWAHGVADRGNGFPAGIQLIWSRIRGVTPSTVAQATSAAIDFARTIEDGDGQSGGNMRRAAPVSCMERPDLQALRGAPAAHGRIPYRAQEECFVQRVKMGQQRGDLGKKSSPRIEVTSSSRRLRASRTSWRTSTPSAVASRSSDPSVGIALPFSILEM